VNTFVNGKMRSVETIPKIEESIKENYRGCEFNYNIL
jgi:hypothetical protein